MVQPRKRLIPKARERQALRRRVGAFLSARRQELGLTQRVIADALGYVSLNSISNLETGREGLPAKRIYAWPTSSSSRATRSSVSSPAKPRRWILAKRAVRQRRR